MIGPDRYAGGLINGLLSSSASSGLHRASMKMLWSISSRLMQQSLGFTHVLVSLRQVTLRVLRLLTTFSEAQGRRLEKMMMATTLEERSFSFE